MIKMRCIKLAICLSTLAGAYPQIALADDSAVDSSSQSQTSQSSPAVAQAPTPSAAPAQSNSSSAKKSFSLGRLPVYIAGVATGAFVGMPINLVRRTVWEQKQGIQGLCGDSTNKVATVSAGAFWLPFSVFLGACEAPVMGPVNSLKNYDKPFSKEQFSLAEIGDGTGRDPG